VSDLQNDVGIKLSQLGFDVNTAADQDLIFSSSWPLLKIAYTGTATFNDASDTTIFTHDLGYPPFYIAFRIDGDNSYLFNDPQFYVNNTVFGNSGSGAGTDITIRYYICRNPLNENFAADVFRTSGVSQSSFDRDFGIKVAKEGKDVSSTDLRDFTIHSGTRSPMIHTIKYGQLEAVGSNYDLVYTNNLGYNPIFFGFHSTDNVKFSGLNGREQSNPKLFTSSTGDLTIRNSSATYGSLVVFKDPFSVTTSTAVTI